MQANPFFDTGKERRACPSIFELSTLKQGFLRQFLVQHPSQPALNLHLRRSLHDNEIMELNDFVLTISSISILPAGGIWIWEKKGCFQCSGLFQTHFKASSRLHLESFGRRRHLSKFDLSCGRGFGKAGLNTMNRIQKRNTQITLSPLPCVCYMLSP